MVGLVVWPCNCVVSNMRPYQNIKWTKRSGVTIMEILVVLAIIALLASVVGPRVFKYLGTAKSETARLQAKSLTSGVRLFYIDTGRYPAETEGLSVLMTAPPGETNWDGPYIESADGLTDPWGRDFVYVIPGAVKDFDIVSLGRDGQQGGDGEDEDISE